MVWGVEAPEQTYFVAKIVIDKTAQFPDYISINEPIPSVRGLKRCIFLKETDTPHNGAQ
jgi:hypothetical protein